MVTHLPLGKDSISRIILFFFFHPRGQAKFLRALHLDNSMVESGSQPWQPAQLPGDIETESKRDWGVSQWNSELSVRHDKHRGVEPELTILA